MNALTINSSLPPLYCPYTQIVDTYGLVGIALKSFDECNHRVAKKHSYVDMAEVQKAAFRILARSKEFAEEHYSLDPPCINPSGFVCAKVCEHSEEQLFQYYEDWEKWTSENAVCFDYLVIPEERVNLAGLVLGTLLIAWYVYIIYQSYGQISFIVSGI